MIFFWRFARILSRTIKKKTLLVLKKFFSFNKNNQFSILLPVFQDYGIEKKFGVIIVNNAFLNNVLCRIIEKYMEETYDKEWLVDK